MVIPALDEEANIEPLAQRLLRTLADLTDRFEIIFVSDGSRDRTCECVRTVGVRDARVKLLHLSRTFGHQNAILAGLDHAEGRVVVTMDADLQHPPEALPAMVRAWEAGADVVHGVRRSVGTPGVWRRCCRRLGYAVLRRLCDVDIIPHSADFRLYDRRAVRAMRVLREHGRFNRGLARWIGFRQAVAPYDEGRRRAGRPKYTIVNLFRLMTDGVLSFSVRPLRYMGISGLCFSLLSGMCLIVVVLGHLLRWPGFREVSGWASLITVVLGMGGFHLMAMWLMGQYVARTYEEVKHRPAYLVAEAEGFPDKADTLASTSRRVPRRRRQTPAPRRPNLPATRAGSPDCASTAVS